MDQPRPTRSETSIQAIAEENEQLRTIEEAARRFVDACYAGQGFATTLVLLVVLGNVLEDCAERRLERTRDVA